jgi:hypothetical protein
VTTVSDIDRGTIDFFTAGREQASLSACFATPVNRLVDAGSSGWNQRFGPPGIPFIPFIASIPFFIESSESWSRFCCVSADWGFSPPHPVRESTANVTIANCKAARPMICFSR